jgi:hypothetical protein
MCLMGPKKYISWNITLSFSTWKNLILGECKWSPKAMGRDVVDTLWQKSAEFVRPKGTGTGITLYLLVVGDWMKPNLLLNVYENNHKGWELAGSWNIVIVSDTGRSGSERVEQTQRQWFSDIFLMPEIVWPVFKQISGFKSKILWSIRPKLVAQCLLGDEQHRDVNQYKQNI